MGNLQRILLALGLGLTAGCAQSPMKPAAPPPRTPASQTALGYSSSLIIEVLDHINSEAGFAFHQVESVRILSSSLVEISLKSDLSSPRTLRFRVTESECSASVCPMVVEDLN